MVYFGSGDGDISRFDIGLDSLPGKKLKCFDEVELTNISRHIYGSVVEIGSLSSLVGWSIPDVKGSSRRQVIESRTDSHGR